MKRKKISSRQKEIILLLAQNTSNKPITISEVAKELNISTRTVLRDMTKIESWLDENDFKFINYTYGNFCGIMETGIVT